jgi:hypothetical protein
MKIVVDIFDNKYSDYMKYTSVSRPLLKIFFNNGFGLYILTAIKFRFFPRFYGIIKKDFWEIGFYFLWWDFEIMWNKSFKV